jgi:hypothetical protein
LRWIVVLLVGTLAAVVAAARHSPQPGNDETDRIATFVANAISFPRHLSAAGLARAALATRAGQAGRLQVVAMEELEADRPEDPMARLVFRVHLPAEQTSWRTIPAVTACYEARFNYYGIIKDPKRMACPPGATPITPPPVRAPAPEVVIPTGAEKLVERLLTDAARTPGAEQVRAALEAGLRDAAARAGTGPGPPPLLPEPQVATDGDDIGVALFEPGDRSCLLGARSGGRVTVWRPSRVQLQPGELSCDPGTALAGLGQRPPH